MVSFGKKRKGRGGNRPGYALKDYMSRMQPNGGLDFGKKRYRRSRRSACSALRSKSKCTSSAMCSWRKGRGCTRRRVKRSSPDFHSTGDDELGSYAEAAGIEFFGRRRRRGRKVRRVRRHRRRVHRRKAHRRHRRVRRKVRRVRRKVRRVRRHRRKVRRVRRHRRKVHRRHRRSAGYGLARRSAGYGLARRSGFGMDKMPCGSNQNMGMAPAFGKRRRVHRRKVHRRHHRKVHRTHRRKAHRRHRRKVPAKLRKLCKKLKIKTTKKVGKHRVSKSISVLKKQITRKLRARRHR